MTTERDQQVLRQGQEARWLQRAAEPVWRDLADAVITRGKMLAKAGTLSDAEAVLLWVKLSAYDDLRFEVESRIAAGEKTAARIHGVE